MSEFKGTKGDWVLIDKTSNTKVITTRGICGDIARVFKEGYISQKEMKANAKLISCAPEMLGMLIRFVNSDDLDITDFMDAKELIKKATEL
jgi:hypothetical protein